MGYSLKPVNPDVESFPFGAFSFPVLLEACGYLWPCIHGGAQWYCVFGADPRMPQGDQYPRILSNDGFLVTDEEARIMARVARNFVTVQRSLPESARDTTTIRGRAEFRREDVANLLLKAMDPTPSPWPQKIRDDFTNTFERFAAWAPGSGGFEIW